MIKVIIRMLSRIYIGYGRYSCIKDEYDANYLESKYHHNKASCYKTLLEKDNVKNDDILLSFICPLYNSEMFIRKCIDSLLNQRTLFNYNIILIDDGSKDSTNKIALDYKKKYPEKFVVIHQDNKGISSARNAGLVVADGEYISFIDHDDWISMDYVEQMLSIAIREKADIVKCSYATVQDNNIVLRYQTENFCIRGQMKEELFQFRSYIWGGVYKRTLFDNICFPEGFWYEDMITRILLYRQAKVYFNIGNTLYYKLIHKNNASRKVWSNRSYKSLEHIYLTQDLIEASNKLGLKEDEWLYKCILLEFSMIMLERIRYLDAKTKKQAFLFMWAGINTAAF